MRKVSVISLVFVLLLMFIVIVPVFADSSKDIPVTVTRTGGGRSYGEIWITDGNTYHERDGITIYANYIITGSGINLVGSSFGTVWGNFNLDTVKGVYHFDSQLTFPGGTFEGKVWYGGTFVIVNGHPVYAAGADATQKGLWVGTGDYQGWVFKLTWVNGVVTEATMHIP